MVEGVIRKGAVATHEGANLRHHIIFRVFPLSLFRHETIRFLYELKELLVEFGPVQIVEQLRVIIYGRKLCVMLIEVMGSEA